VGALDPTLGLARIDADDVDVHCTECTPKLGHAVAAQRAWMIDAKYPVLVTIKGHRLAPGFEVGASRMKIRKGRLALDGLEMHQPTRRVIDDHEQCALRAAILELSIGAEV